MAMKVGHDRRWGRAVFYGWWLVGLALILNAVVTSPVWGGVGIWVKALEQHFGWSRTQLTFAFSLGQFEGSVTGPFVGYLIDRLGTRWMVFIGILMTGTGFVLFSMTRNLGLFYVSFAIIMLGTSTGAWLPMMTAINHWFRRRRSTAMGIASGGFSLGGVALAPVLAWSVTPEHFGWQTTARWIGILFVVAAWPVTRLIRNRPEEYGQRPDGDSPPDAPANEASPRTSQEGAAAEPGPDFTAREAVRTTAFWLIALGHGLSSMLIATLTVHLVPSLVDQGLSLQGASYVWALVMAVAGVSQFIGGYVGDRVHKNLALFALASVQAGGFGLAVLVRDVPTAFLFAMVFGIGFGGRVPLTTAIRGDYFGQRAFATITGISMTPMFAFMLVAPLFAAAMFDARGSYFLPFVILACLGGLSGVFFLLAKKPTLARPGPRIGPTGDAG